MTNYQSNTDRYCLVCGTTHGLHRHHWIHTRKARPDLKETPWNIIDLCWKCHSMAHSMGRISFFNTYGKRMPKELQERFKKEVG